MADISKIEIPSGASTAQYNLKDATARSDISTINGKIPSGASSSNKMATASDLPVANPSGTATTALTKLKVGSTVYSISSGGGSTVTVDTDGSGSSSSAKYQRVNVDSTHYEIEGTRYMESLTKSTSSGTDTFTFTNVTDASNKTFDYYCDKFGVAPIDVTISGTTVNVKFASSDNVTKCRIYIRG